MSRSPEFTRKNIRLPLERYRGRGLYFVTLCFHQRRQRGSNARIASWIISRLKQHAKLCDFFVHAYCLMPDHAHILAAGASDNSNLIKFIESFKQATGAAFARRTGQRLWQFKYYDHIVRGSESADRVAWYIWMNPVRKGLCPAPAEYPYLGSFTQIGARILAGAATSEWLPPWKQAACRAQARGATFKPSEDR